MIVAIHGNYKKNSNKGLVTLRYSFFANIVAAFGFVALLPGCNEKAAVAPSGNSITQMGFEKVAPLASRNCTTLQARERNMVDNAMLEDTRIIAVGDVTLYVPISWLNGYLIDDLKMGSVSPNSFAAFVGKFSPDLRRRECAGIVHTFAVGERVSRYGGMGFKVSTLPPSVIASDRLSLMRVKEVIIQVHEKPTLPPEDAFRESLVPGRWIKVPNYPTYKMRDTVQVHGICTATRGRPASEWVISRFITPSASIGLVIDANREVPAPDWAPYCEALFPLFQWLTKHPAERTNHDRNYAKDGR